MKIVPQIMTLRVTPASVRFDLCPLVWTLFYLRKCLLTDYFIFIFKLRSTVHVTLITDYTWIVCVFCDRSQFDDLNVEICFQRILPNYAAHAYGVQRVKTYSVRFELETCVCRRSIFERKIISNTSVCELFRKSENIILWIIDTSVFINTSVFYCFRIVKFKLRR